MAKVKVGIVLLTVLLVLSVLAMGCQPQKAVEPPPVTYEDGKYRGGFFFDGVPQVNIEFVLDDNIITWIRWRHMQYKDVDYLKSEDPVIIGLRDQHMELTDYLLGKDIRVALKDLHRPADIVTKNPTVDVFTAATLRATKVLSTFQDALNRGVYLYPGAVLWPEVAPVPKP